MINYIYIPIFTVTFALSPLMLQPVFAKGDMVKVDAAQKVEFKKIVTGSILGIKVFGEKELTSDYKVSEEGFVSFPLVGDVQATELTIQEFRQVLTKKLKKYIIDPQVSVQFSDDDEEVSGEGGSDSVLILGQSRKQGAQKVTERGTTLMTAIATSGGLGPLADPTKIKVVQVREGVKTTKEYNIHDILNGKKDDPIIKRGDIVFIPESIF